MLITKDDYYNSRGIDLSVELNGNTDNESNEVNIFLNTIETWLLNYIKLNYKESTTPEPIKTNALKEALMCQIDYVLIQGDLSKTMTSIDSQMLAPNAFIVLKANGLANIDHNCHRTPLQLFRRKY